MQHALVCCRDLFACSDGLLIKLYSMYKMEKKKLSLLLGSGGTFEWEGYFGTEKLHIAEAYTSSRDRGQVGAS